MDPPLRLRLRHPLHAVRAGLEFQAREGPVAGDAADDLLVTAVLSRALAQHLDGEPLRLGIARVHAKQIPGEECRLIAARAGAHLEEEAFVIARVPGEQERAQLRLRGGELRLQPADFLGAERAHAGIGVLEHVARSREVALELVVVAQALRERLEASVLDRKVAELGRATRDVTGGEQPADFLEAIGELLEPLANGFLHRLGVRAFRICVAQPSGQKSHFAGGDGADVRASAAL